MGRRRDLAAGAAGLLVGLALGWLLAGGPGVAPPEAVRTLGRHGAVLARDPVLVVAVGSAGDAGRPSSRGPSARRDVDRMAELMQKPPSRSARRARRWACSSGRRAYSNQISMV